MKKYHCDKPGSPKHKIQDTKSLQAKITNVSNQNPKFQTRRIGAYQNSASYFQTETTSTLINLNSNKNISQVQFQCMPPQNILLRGAMSDYHSETAHTSQIMGPHGFRAANPQILKSSDRK